MQILDVLRIDDKKFSVTINMYFSVLWDEDRLVQWNLDIVTNFNRTQIALL